MPPWMIYKRYILTLKASSRAKDFYRAHSHWKLYNYYNTAKSAQYVKESATKTKAAVGERKATKLYGLKVIKANINTNQEKLHQVHCNK